MIMTVMKMNSNDETVMPWSAIHLLATPASPPWHPSIGPQEINTCAHHIKRHLVSLSEDFFVSWSWLLMLYNTCQLNQYIYIC